jgi:hypothetical protein
MALAHSPSIVTNGLVLVYDMSNTGRSWKGAPTTNLVPNPYANWNGSSFVFGGYNYDATGTQTYTYVTNVSNPIGSPAVMQYTTGTTGYKYWAVQGTVATTGTHTFSYYARIISGPTATSNLSNSQLWRSNGVDQAVTGDWNPTYTTEWVRYSTTGPCTAGTVLDYFPIHSGGLTGGYTIQYCGFQLELGTYATPFVNGTRSTTQALLDPTGQNTITATSLTYPSDGSFSFNGSTNRITCPSTSALDFAGSQQYTVMAWIYPLLGGGTWHGIVSKGESQQYAFTVNSPGAYIHYETNQGGVGALNSAGGSITQNAWQYVGIRFDGTNKTIWKNGEIIATQAAAVNSTSNTEQLRVGEGNANELFNGNITQVTIYNRALSDNEVRQNFNALRGRYGI